MTTVTSLPWPRGPPPAGVMPDVSAITERGKQVDIRERIVTAIQDKRDWSLYDCAEEPQLSVIVNVVAQRHDARGATGRRAATPPNRHRPSR